MKTAVSTTLVLSLASVNIFNNNKKISNILAIIFLKNIGNSLPVIFTGDTKLSRLTRLTDRAGEIDLGKKPHSTKTAFYFH